MTILELFLTAINFVFQKGGLDVRLINWLVRGKFDLQEHILPMVTEVWLIMVFRVPEILTVGS